MTHEQFLQTRKNNEAILLEYFSKVGILTASLKKATGFNARNNEVEFLTLECASVSEFDYHKSSFFYANKKGGDYFTWTKVAEKYYLSISISDEWN